VCFFFYFSIGKQQGDMGVALLIHYTARQSEHAAEKEVTCAEQEGLASGLATAGSPRAARRKRPLGARAAAVASRRRLHSLASFNIIGEGVLCKYTPL
jgi:hypothetical protein